MAIDFRCENCGKLLSVEAEESSKIKCPHCKAKVSVPAGLASLPSPHVPGDADISAQRPDQPVGVVEAEEEVLAPEGSDALMGVMATAMPWVISLFFHAGILVILAFFAIIVSQKKVDASTVVPDFTEHETLTDQIVAEMSPDLDSKNIKADDQFAKRDSKVPMSTIGETKSKVTMYGSEGGGANAQMGFTAGGGKGPKAGFFGVSGSAYHIVYVVDCSGSMLGDFDLVRSEIIKSISRLKSEQTFHVIFFTAGKPKENLTRRLVYAKVKNKRDALKYLKGVAPESTKGFTDPTDAIRRAFAVLRNTPGDRSGKLIYLLTDGEFADNEKVLSAIRTLNTKKDVHINTVLFIFQDEEAGRGLKQIANENKGKFKFVERGE